MRKHIIVALCLWLGANGLGAQTVGVTLTTDEHVGCPAAVGRVQDNLSALLTEINVAQKANRDLNIVGLPLDDFAKKSLTMMWANIHFYCDDEEIVGRCWVFEDGFMVRQIPLIITPRGETFGSGTYQEAVAEFDKNGNIKDFRFALDAQLTEGMEKCGEVVGKDRYMTILKYLEQFRTAYNTKDIQFIKQVFCDDAAVVFVGGVVKDKPTETSYGSQKVVYKKQAKQQYISNLQRAFIRSKWIDVKFSQIGDSDEEGGCFGITRSSVNPNIYGVRLRQEWRSSNYNDGGYLFLLWDFTNENEPVIHVRTWQPEWVDGQKLPEKDVFSLTYFDL